MKLFYEIVLTLGLSLRQIKEEEEVEMEENRMRWKPEWFATPSSQNIQP